MSLARSIGVLSLALALGAGAGADVVALRPSVRIPAQAGAPVTLDRIADLTGPDAQRLAETVIVPDPAKEMVGGVVRIEMARVRAALDAARVNWGRIELTGGACALRVEGAKPDAPDKPLPPSREPKAIDLSGPPTVRTYACITLCELFGVEPSEIRVAFEAADQALLDIPEEGRRIDVQPQGSERSSRAPLGVWVYEGDRVMTSGTVRADVLLRRDAATLTRPVQRGGTIQPGDVTEQSVWLAPGVAALSVADVVGASTKSRLLAGSPVRDVDIDSPVVVKRGDVVSVHCVSGGVALKSPARATSDGHTGDVIEFRLEKSKKTFKARVDGRGRAVMDLTEPAPDVGAKEQGR